MNKPLDPTLLDHTNTLSEINRQADADPSEKYCVTPEVHRGKLSRLTNFIVSFAILAICIFAYTLLGEREQPERAPAVKSGATMVTTQALRLHDGPVPIEVNGVAVPLREIRLATEVSGRVVEQSPNLRTGRMVDAGEVLIRLDAIEFELEVKRLRAQAAQEAAEVASVDVSIKNTHQLTQLAEQQFELAKSERGRVDLLSQRQAASAAEVDVVKRSELTSKSSLVEIGNRLRELEAQHHLLLQKRAMTDVMLQRAQLDLSRCVVRTPIRGRVVASSVEEQSYVPAGTSFVTIEDTAAVEVRCNLTADQMVWVWSSHSGQDLELPAPSSTTDSDPSIVSELQMQATLADDDRVPSVPATISYEFGSDTHTWPAVLQRIDGAGIDPQTRTYPCLFRVSNPASAASRGRPQQLTRGMFVSVSMETQPERTLYEVDEIAIRPGNRVWLNVGERLRVVPVTIVSRLPNSIVIDMHGDDSEQTSLAAASIIISPVSNPLDGMAIAATPDSQPDVKLSESDADPNKILEPNPGRASVLTSTLPASSESESAQ